MLELKNPVQTERRPLLLTRPSRASYDPNQRRLMVAALALLLIALGFVIYKDRDFWFPGTEEANLDQPVETPAAVSSAPPAPVVATAIPIATARRAEGKGASSGRTSARTSGTKAATNNSSATPPPVTPAPAAVNRTVLPPLEVEVIAGDTHRTIRPGTNSVRVDLQPGTAPQGVGVETAAGVTENAAERVQMSTDTTAVVTSAVKPGYPLLARQMKVEGSVILRALIGKDGIIQDLHVISGPPILAGAARDAVRQWHFRPHYEGAEAVETQAKITVNFTISTN